MEPPARFAADSVRAEKAQVLEAVQIPTTDEVLRNSVRAQYDDGFVENQPVEPYRKTKTSTRTARPKPMSPSS